jgi:hypothetical protein
VGRSAAAEGSERNDQDGWKVKREQLNDQVVMALLEAHAAERGGTVAVERARFCAPVLRRQRAPLGRGSRHAVLGALGACPRGPLALGVDVGAVGRFRAWTWTSVVLGAESGFSTQGRIPLGSVVRGTNARPGRSSAPNLCAIPELEDNASTVGNSTQPADEELGGGD